MTFTCLICNSLFSSISNINRHLRRVHNKDPMPASKQSSDFKCLERNCGCSFKKNEELVSHLQLVHYKKFEYEEIALKDMTDFLQWKSSIENNKWRYNLKSKNKCGTGVKYYYYCNRSGKGLRDEGKHNYKRVMKSQGSCKMGSHCTSNIKLIVQHNEFTCVWQKTHYGHSSDLRHIRLSKDDRNMIASKLIAGAQPFEILESVRCNIGKELSRIDLLTMKDIINIKTAFNIQLKNDAKKKSKRYEYLMKGITNECDPLKQKQEETKSLIFSTCSKLQHLDVYILNEDFLNEIHKQLGSLNTLLSHSQVDENDFRVNIDSKISKPQEWDFINLKTDINGETENERSLVHESMEMEPLNKSINNPTLFISKSSSYDHQYY